MPLLQVKNVYLSIGQHPLLDYVSFDIEPKSRIALIGRNGEGKSTLLKIMAGLEAPDDGLVIKDKSVKIAYLPQELPPLSVQSVFDYISDGLSDIGKLLQAHHHHLLAPHHDDSWMDNLNRLQEQLDTHDAWNMNQRIEKVITELNLPPDRPLKELSGGWRRRVAIARALVQEPDLLLLDEPTNHLDISAIQWLESFMANYNSAMIFITHDRMLMQNAASKILELDRGRITLFDCTYEEYLSRKEKMLADEERHNKEFDKKLSAEETWIRQGIKARRTRNEGRVRALKALRQERAQRREKASKAKFVAQKGNLSAKMLITCEHLHFSYPNKPIVKDLSFTLQRGDKLAIIGDNGAGKTTLVQLMLDKIHPDSGTVKHSPNNQIAFFDQNRHAIDPEKSVIENVIEGDEFVEINGKRKHGISYLGDFLFSPSKCQSPARTLSGGECNRLLLAKLFSKPANILVLDEPTNDLDIESLELLEGILAGFQGAVIIISHDRHFIDNIATQSLFLHGNGHIEHIFGGYSDYESYASTKPKAKSQADKAIKLAKVEPVQTQTDSAELKRLTIQIEKLENKIAQLKEEMEQPDFKTQADYKIKQANKKLSLLEEELTSLYERWESIE